MSKNSLALTGRPFTIDSFNIHRLIIAGVMVSSKFFSDVFYTNTRYAKVKQKKRGGRVTNHFYYRWMAEVQVSKEENTEQV